MVSCRSGIARSEEQCVYVRYCTTSEMPIYLCYQCFGDLSKGLPAVLLIAGMNMQLCAWDDSFCEMLAEKGFFVIRFDNRDIGHSTKIEKRGSVVPTRLLLPQCLAFGEQLPYSIADMAKDAIALLDVLGIDAAHLIGVSMGGMIAQTMALMFPKYVLSLTSIMSTTNAPDLPEPTFMVKLKLLRRAPANCTVEKLVDFRIRVLKELLEGTKPVDEEYLRSRYLMSLNRSSYSDGIIRQAAAIRRCAGRDESLRLLKCAALVIHGEKDVLIPVAHGIRTAAVIPRAKLVVIPDMGHYFHQDFFEEVVKHFVDVTRSSVKESEPAPVLPCASSLSGIN
ncbi:putative hydrolase, alpha/beta fold family [Trypanosoma vivax]|uniref:Putative hydrolase, alpha/beta fold family n=1 Tax=Trypanosoma vivax (strain Y486) TaxID=1055687 RepID=G0TVK2_TRYVY|nr:putative hydrolase, alpha/beta fold family [Trypanosoma vivax]CCC47968.1 putative hydrolase, alpha/beta fold family [Trypanosoma vivax Y486]